MSKVEIRLVMQLEDLDGQPLSSEAAEKAGDLAVDAIRHRLFGQGFLPDDVMVDEYSVSVCSKPMRVLRK